MKYLKTSKDKICYDDGSQVMLRGTCVGGFMNFEDFINGYPGTEHGIRKQLENVLGSSTSNYFFRKMSENFFGEEDLKFLQSLGANCIRVPLNYRRFESDENPFSFKEEGFKQLESLLTKCEKYGIYVILDMHAVQGWQNSHWHCDNERGASLFWVHRHFQERLAGLWHEIASRYKNRPVVAGYELMNEPATGTPNGDHPFDFYENYNSDWKKINSVYTYLIDTIRSVDKNHIIFLEGDFYGKSFSGLDSPVDDNIVYSLHHYTPPGFGPGPYPGWYGTKTQKTYWNRDVYKEQILSTEGYKFATKHKVPLLVGEFGSQYHGPKNELSSRLQSIDDQLSVYNELNLHWTTWTYKDMGAMGWVSLKSDSEYSQKIEPIQKMKNKLGSENFTAIYKKNKGRILAKKLADFIVNVSQEPYDKRLNSFCFNHVALTGYASALLQPAYAKLFTNYSQKEINQLLESFKFGNCTKNELFINILKKHLS